jgi:peptide/nickel transport system permease protein
MTVERTPAQQPLEDRDRTRWWRSKPAKRFRRNPLAIVGALLILGFAVVALIAPQITDPSRSCLRDLGLTAGTIGDLNDPRTGTFWRAIFWAPESCYTMPRASFSPIPEAPSSDYVLGTTSSGYDVLYGLVWGTRTAFRIGLIVVGISLVLGLVVGGLAGYLGGWVDEILMRFTDVVIAFPSLVLAIVIVTLLGQTLTNVIVAISLVAWPNYARVIRGEILKVKSLDYVESARALGGRGLRIFFRHVLPNTLAPLIVVASLDMGSVVLTAAALSFLGLGPPLGYADWGQMVNFARDWILGPPGQPLAYWHTSFYPGMAILFFVLGWNLLGDAFRDAFDPRDA